MNKNDLKNVALAVGGTYVGAGSGSTYESMIQKFMRREVLNVIRKVIKGTVVSNFEFTKFLAYADGTFDFDSTITLRAPYTYDGLKQVEFDVDCGRGVAEMWTRKEQLSITLEYVDINSSAKFEKLLTRLLSKIAKRAKKSK